MAPEIDRRVFRDLSYGLSIVTFRADGRLNGQIVNTVVQVTSDPARVAVISNLFPCFPPAPPSLGIHMAEFQ